MSINLFIPPINFSNTIIIWSKINYWNYIRGLTVLLGSLFLPGASLFNIFLPNNLLFKKFRNEIFIIKITLYPILSFLFIGVIVLIIDFFNFYDETFFLSIIYFIIIILFVIDLTLQKFRTQKKDIKNYFINSKESSVSLEVLLILLLMLGISIISLSINISVQYLIPGDSWKGIEPAIYIGKFNDSPLKVGIENGRPIFWSYILFGLKVLSGLPLVNLSVILSIFNYLYISSIYIFYKITLKNFNHIIIILSCLFSSIFSGLYFASPLLNYKLLSGLIFYGELNFIYKSYALILIINSLSLFIFSIEYCFNRQLYKFLQKENIFFIFLSATFLIVSYMVYMIPMIPGILIIFIYIIYSERRTINLSIFNLMLLISLTLFFIFDFLTSFFLSYLFYIKFNWIFNIGGILKNFMIYIFLFSIIILNTFLISFIRKRKKIFKKGSFKKKRVIWTIYMIFNTLFFAIEIMILLFLFKYNLFDFNYYNSFFFPFILLLDIFYMNIGIIGIIGILSLVFIYKKNRRWFKISITWIIIIFLYSLLVYFLKLFSGLIIASNNPSLLNKSLFEIIFWFSRNWYYTIPILSICCATGIIYIIKTFEKKIIKYNFKNIILWLKLLIISIIIIVNFTNFGITTLYWQNPNLKITDEEAQVIGWVSKNLPPNSNILTENKYNLYHGIQTTTSSQIFLTSIFKNNRYYVDSVNIIKNNNIRYAVLFNSHIKLDKTLNRIFDNILLKYIFTKKIFNYNNLNVYFFPNEASISYYQASFDFMIYENGSTPSSWGNGWYDASIENSTVKILSQEDDHINVICLYTDSGKSAFGKIDSLQTNGTIEFWLKILNTNEKFFFKLKKENLIALGFGIYKNKWGYLNSSGVFNIIQEINQTPQQNEWYHIRIDFESSINGYQGLDQFTWKVIIDNLYESKPISFINKSIGWNTIYFENYNNYGFIDAIGVSWDLNYRIGNNFLKKPLI
ncbi:MAG: hypothetical protein ACP6IY_18430 [Promethearchaeia archaeon]